MKHNIIAQRVMCAVIATTIFWFVADEGEAAEFTIDQGGVVTAGQQNYTSLAEYVGSDYFRQNGKRCGTQSLGADQDERIQKAITDCTTSLTKIKSEYYPAEVYLVPIWWHVIYNSSGVGNISNASITAQMEALNEDYRAKSGTIGSNGYDVKIQFELAGITRTQNDSWFNDGDGYKEALNKDPNRYVNIYTNTASGNLGYTYYPQDAAGQVIDGIVLLYQSVGGRDNGFYNFDQGRTLVHEMGHYLGLAHTFDQSSCSNTYSTGDLIVDTNAESEEHYGCVQTYTCGTADPINNYMDYSDDICMYLFTQEQANRAVCSLVNYRPNLYTTEAVSGVTVAPLLAPLIMRQ